jgi:hypothetical protein
MRRFVALAIAGVSPVPVGQSQSQPPTTQPWSLCWRSRPACSEEQVREDMLKVHGRRTAAVAYAYAKTGLLMMEGMEEYYDPGDTLPSTRPRAAS